MNYTKTYLTDLQAAYEVPQASRLKGKSVCITGATGLIGSCVADALFVLNKYFSFGIKVYLGGRSAEKMAKRFKFWDGYYEYLPYDAIDCVFLPEHTDFIVHCAGNAHPAAYSEQPVETALGIVQGAAGMLQTLANCGFGRLLLVSSSEVYGKRGGIELYREDDYEFIDPLSVRSCYPNAKRMAETFCAAYHDEYGVDYVVARPGHVYGPTAAAHDTRAHAQFARKAARGEDIVMKSDGSQLRSYCYCVDCAMALLTILLNGTSGEAYNIAYGPSNVSVRQLAECFAEVGGVGISFETPSDAEAKGYNLMSCSALDSSKIEGIGWRGRFDVAVGARRTIECLRTR